MNNLNYYCLRPVSLLKSSVSFLLFVMLSSCAVKEPIRTVYIHEPTLETVEYNVEILPSTKLPVASLEQARDSYIKLLKSTQNSEIIVESLQRLAEIESMIAENKLDQEQQQQMKHHLQIAAGYYQQLLEQYPAQINQTSIRYQLARVSDLEGNTEFSQKLLNQLSQLKGEQHEIIEAGFRMAETAFSRKQYQSALKLYNGVLSHKNEPQKGKLNRFYNAALFKRGWTHFKRQKYELAVNDFIGLLHIIYKPAEKRNGIDNNFINETNRVMSLSLSYLEGPKTLSKYFYKNGHAVFEAELYLSLANFYLEQERFQDTANTYFTFVKSKPLDILAPEFEQHGIDVLSKTGFLDLVMDSKENFVKHYQTGAYYWEQTGRVRTEPVSNWLYKNITDVINFYHAQAQQSKNPQDYLAAAKWYRVFIKSFHDHKERSDKQWLLAEALNDAGDIEGSISEYQILAYQPNNLSNQRKEEAGFRVVLGRQNIFTALTNKKTDKNNGTSQKALNVFRQQLIDSGMAYKNTFIGAKRVPQVVAQTIELQLSNNQIAPAVTLAREVPSIEWVTESHRKRAREVVANGEFDLKHYALAEVAFIQLFKQDRYQASKMQIFHERRAQAIFKQAEMAKQEQQFTQAIEHFLRLGKIEPKSKIRSNAEFDAATLLLQIKDYARATAVLEKFVLSYPENPLIADLPAKLIVAYEALENWQEAAKQYEIVAKTSTDEKITRSAIWQAASSWMKLDDTKSQNKSVATWKKYIKKYPYPVDLALEARNNLIDLYGVLKVKWKQDFWRRKIIITVDSYKLQDLRARTLAAQSQLSLANDNYIGFKAIKLTQPLRKSLKAKRKKLTLLLKGYSKVLDYRIQPLSTEAGHKLGESYAILAKSILDSERPKGMSELELEEYETLLEERVFPFEDDAINALEANITLTKLGVWDLWIQKSFSQLEKLMPARYVKPEVIDDYATDP